MSVVHDNLRREDQREHPDAVRGSSAPPETGLCGNGIEADRQESDYTRELRRKQRLLVAGIKQLQDRVDTLTRELDHALKDNEQLRALVRAAAPGRLGEYRQSLISQAME